MNEIVRQRVRKAEGDFNSALREYRARKCPNCDSACFRARQCIEKCMKGLLLLRVPFAKTHDLSVLLDSILPGRPDWADWRDALRAAVGMGTRA